MIISNGICGGVQSASSTKPTQRVRDLELRTGRTEQEEGMSSLTDQKGVSPQFASRYSLSPPSEEETVPRSHLEEFASPTSCPEEEIASVSHSEEEASSI